MEKQEMKFATGMSFKARHENAPDTVRGSVYFKAEEFKKFLDENKDERGWVHTKMMKSKEKGTIYFILDTWKPTPLPETTQATQEYNDTKYQVTRTSPTEDHPDGLPTDDFNF